ncbi:MAG: low molecular weight phosphotyrosine protein phosphatase [Lentisphaeria bacterium]|nr:low molecular weight phosphotyrosine protein phosphatase [Lentisphaeria bacterium]
MKKILFVCHGNICRSPMAEFVMKKMVRDAGAAEEFEIASAATSTEELGNGVYPPARRILNAHGIDCSGKYARQITMRDYEYYDLLIGMDNANMRNMKRFFGGDPSGKLRMLMDYTETPGEVADPWYSGDFEQTWQDVNAGCSGLLDDLLQ